MLDYFPSQSSKHDRLTTHIYIHISIETLAINLLNSGTF